MLHESRNDPAWLWWLIGHVAVVLAALVVAFCPAAAEPERDPHGQHYVAQAGEPKVPPADDGDFFAGGTDWLNTGKPLTAGDLRGRVVLLDFWTLC